MYIYIYIVIYLYDFDTVIDLGGIISQDQQTVATAAVTANRFEACTRYPRKLPDSPNDTWLQL